MTTGPDPLLDALRDLADNVDDADLYGLALRRSRQIAHQRTAAGTVTALAVLGLACGGLWYLAPPDGRRESRAVAIAEPTPSAPAPAQSASAAPSPSTRPSARIPTPPPRQPRPARLGTATPWSRSLSDLPGQVFYNQQGDEPQVVRLNGERDTRTVLSAPHSTLGVSTDGRRIAYVQDGSLLVVATDGGTPQRPYDGTVSDQQAPTWSPDGSRLLVGAGADPAVLDLADGTLEALPSGLAGTHFRWSGDGSKLVYTTTSCQLKVVGTTPSVAATDPAVTVPVLGDPDEAANPSGLGACRLVSVDATGSRVAAPLQQVYGDDEDRGVASAVVDTATGGADVLPVSGLIIGTVFDAGGNLLVRAVNQGENTLSLFSPDGTLLVQAPEPSGLRALELVAYTN